MTSCFSGRTPPSVIWINGPFGVGKSTTAALLRERIPGSVIINPESIGAVLARLCPRRPPDYQDLRLWRVATAHLVGVVARSRRSYVIVPMTVLRQKYVEALHGPLRRAGIEVHHVVLDADASVVLRRIADDIADPKARSWRETHLHVYLESRPWLETTAHRIDTSNLSPSAVAASVQTFLLGESR